MRIQESACTFFAYICLILELGVAYSCDYSSQKGIKENDYPFSLRFFKPIDVEVRTPISKLAFVHSFMISLSRYIHLTTIDVSDVHTSDSAPSNALHHVLCS
jgi:hypothetical protein